MPPPRPRHGAHVADRLDRLEQRRQRAALLRSRAAKAACCRHRHARRTRATDPHDSTQPTRSAARAAVCSAPEMHSDAARPAAEPKTGSKSLTKHAGAAGVRSCNTAGSTPGSAVIVVHRTAAFQCLAAQPHACGTCGTRHGVPTCLHAPTYVAAHARRRSRLAFLTQPHARTQHAHAHRAVDGCFS